jgi:hypothetical protein
MLFDDRHRLPALQAGAKRELCFYVRRRLEPAPSEGDYAVPQVALRLPAVMKILPFGQAPPQVEK